MRRLFLIVLVAIVAVTLVASGAEAGKKDKTTAVKRTDSKALCWIVTPWPFRGACAAKDTDGDGVTDDKDRCPGTPMGAEVDCTGCPIDTDGDGVYDGLDKCPKSPKGAKVDMNGCCLDGDGDGVPDGIDKCPKSPKGAKVDAKGCCLDADGDGVPDGIDTCPGTPKGAKVDANGCPKDSDGDGVFDGIDMCPGSPKGAKVNEKGCPVEVTPMERELFDTGTICAQTVTFKTNKSELTDEAKKVLDEIGAILMQYPEIRVEIGGHTDAAGPEAFNQTLSEKRAKSVLAYLKAKYPKLAAGIAATKGYGESKPIADNGTAAGRAKNRRVEFKVLNMEDFKCKMKERGYEVK